MQVLTHAVSWRHLTSNMPLEQAMGLSRPSQAAHAGCACLCKGPLVHCTGPSSSDCRLRSATRKRQTLGLSLWIKELLKDVHSSPWSSPAAQQTSKGEKLDRQCAALCARRP